MKLSSLRLAGVLVCAAMVVSGCRCGTTGTKQQPGEIGVVYEVDGNQLTNRDATYDFGPVFMGQQGKLKLVVKNLRGGAIGLESLTKESGEAFDGDTTHEPSPVFGVTFETKAVSAGETVEYDMVFNSPQDPAQPAVDHTVKLVLKASNTEAGAETATITLHARAISGVCELPKTLNFGAVAKGDITKITVELKNPSPKQIVANVGDIYSSSASGDDKAFAFAADSARGNVTLAPSNSRNVVIGFSPTEIKSYLAFVKMRASAECPEFVVSLVGDGVDKVLSWTNPVDFGYVTPGGLAVSRELTFKNASLTDVTLSNFKTASAEYKVVPAAGQDVTKLVVPGKNGELKLSLTFKPTVLGPRNSSLTFNTTLSKQPNGAADLKGFGGGPDIQVVPAPVLNFGKVAYFAGATPASFQTRKVTVMNVGTKPVTPDLKANLRLGQGGVGKPYTSAITAIQGDLAEISIADLPVSGPGSYDPSVGIEASAGKNLVDLVVRLTPTTIGPKEFEFIIYSNDPDEAETKITVKADVVVLPPCNYSVTPTALNFGLVSPPSYRDLTFTIKNLGQNAGEVCLLSNLDMAAASDPVFSLPAGSVASKELQPNETLQVAVRAWPQGTVPTTIKNVTGQAEFFMSSPNKPQTLVQLQASIAASCLTIYPNDLDFGTVQKGCNSATRTFTIYNTCVSSVTLASFVMQAGAGQPAGGPDCPGTVACPEFLLVSTPAIPTGGLVIPSGASPITFTAKYKPIDLGADSGAIALNAVQAGQNVTYLVTLQGKGDVVGLNTDVFTQDSKPQADILLTIDDSCSMSDKQQSLAANFGSFIQYATSANVDYHLAVTTTDDDSTGPQGRFKTGTADPDKVLTPTSANVEAQFKAKVNVGINGSGTETGISPSLKALTAPLITNENAGFLRNDAQLAVVVVSDAPDQSAPPVSFFYNSFINIKGAKRSNLFTFNAIVGFNPSPPTGCSYDTGPDDGRYAQLVTQTNGVKGEICTPDWATTLEQLGKTAFGFRTNFFLNGSPDLSGGHAIVVKIDGVDLPAIDVRGSTVWTFDPVANSINFEPMFVPEPGQTLTITYYVTCF